MNEQEIKLKMEKLKSWIFNTVDSHDQYQENFKNIIDMLKNRLNVDHKNFIQMVDINHPIVSRKLSQHCAYINGNYVGKLYLDKYGNVFNAIHEIVDKYEEDFVLCSPNRWEQYAESIYVPEINSIVIAVWTWHRSVESILTDENMISFSDNQSLFTTNEPLYYIVTQDLEVIDRNRPNKGIECLMYLTAGDMKVKGLIESVKQLLKLNVGVVNIGGNKYVPLDTTANLSKYASYKAKSEHKSGKIQNKIDELVSKKEFDCTPMKNRMPHEYYNLICKTHINKIDDTLCVIRWSYSYRDEGFDGMRVYIDGKDVYACKRNNQGQFVKVALSTLNQKNFAAEYNSELVMDDMTGTKLEWYSSVINTIPEEYRITFLMLFLTDVRIEQLVKLGFADSICKILETNKTNTSTAIRTMVKVNPEVENNKNIYRWLGVNKYQMTQISNKFAKHELLHIIGQIKTIFNRDDISSFDNQLFDSILAAYESFAKLIGAAAGYAQWWYTSPYQIANLLKKVADVDPTGTFENNMLHYIPTLLTFIDWDARLFGIYSDFVTMILNMSIRQKVKLYPTTKEELQKMHDDVTAVYNMKKNEYQRKAFETRAKELQKMEYENNEFDFCVRVPEKPEDLIVEGFELHHCVKSYIDRVAAGKTNVLFIRKKDEVDKPFFTVEVDNDRVIRQVHGFSNRNADTEPNMVEFVSRWAKNKRLKVGAFNTVRG